VKIHDGTATLYYQFGQFLDINMVGLKQLTRAAHLCFDFVINKALRFFQLIQRKPRTQLTRTK
jgi:hypothetical protein